MVRSLAISLVVLVVLAGCQNKPKKLSQWPPEDFLLDVDYTVVTDGKRQVKQSARIFSDGLVVYREADRMLRSRDGKTELPVFRRMCVYRMRGWSIRELSRMLHRAPVSELGEPPAAPAIDGESHLIRFQLTYMSNHFDVVAQNRAVGVMNHVLRVVNQFLPPGRPILMPKMAGEVEEIKLLDVPEPKDSLEGAVKFHERWLAEDAKNPRRLRDTFSLACAARNWALAESCLVRLAESRPADFPVLRQILSDHQAAAGSRPQD